MSGHTKEPWTVTHNSWDVSSIYAGNRLVAACQIDSEVTEDTQDKYEAEKEANARLIAAAPDLLEALDELLFEDSDKTEAARLATRLKARAAIAKAIGPDDRDPVGQVLK